MLERVAGVDLMRPILQTGNEFRVTRGPTLRVSSLTVQRGINSTGQSCGFVHCLLLTAKLTTFAFPVRGTEADQLMQASAIPIPLTDEVLPDFHFGLLRIDLHTFDVWASRKGRFVGHGWVRPRCIHLILPS
jgi:hypothetical protein